MPSCDTFESNVHLTSHAIKIFFSSQQIHLHFFFKISQTESELFWWNLATGKAESCFTKPSGALLLSLGSLWEYLII